MKKLLTLLAIALAFQCVAQDSEYLKLWNQYHDECSIIVNDTLTEHGTVTYDINPVDGDLKLIPVDTTWIKQTCNDYKEYSHSNIWASGGSGMILTTNTGNTFNNYYIEESVKEKFTTDISRQKVCKVRLREPTQQGFWEWLKEKGHRK